MNELRYYGSTAPNSNHNAERQLRIEVAVHDHDQPEYPDSVPAGVEIRIPATPAQLSALRAVAADLAMRNDFHLDAIADLRMAVDEAATTLVGRAAPHSELTCRFSPSTAGIEVSMSVVSPDSGALRKDTFSWRVLRTLADAVSVQISPGDPDEPPVATKPGTNPTKHLVRIDLVKRHHGTVTG